MVDKNNEKSKITKKYKHKDEDTWIAENPGKEFKPFDPERELTED